MKKVNYLLALILLFIFGCGQGPKQASEPTDSVNADSIDEEIETAIAEASKDITEIAGETALLSTLIKAVRAGDLLDTLKGEGPFTVFAPTNQAFSSLPEGTLDDLLKPENKDQLIKILTYHVISGKLMSTDLSDGMTAETINTSRITVSTEGGVKINNANILSSDIEAVNGVVHMIDAVIMPPGD